MIVYVHGFLLTTNLSWLTETARKVKGEIELRLSDMLKLEEVYSTPCIIII